MISSERFEKALTELPSAQWRLFERLANVFLASEFTALRPVADPSGDGGADALLFALEDDPTTLVQYSVRKDWKAKISETCKRLQTTFPKTRVLIFVTNRVMGSDIASERKRVRKNWGIHLDPRDQEWLVSQRNATQANSQEAEQLATHVVDPLLSSSGLIERQAQALDDLEAKAAFVHLGLQWADESKEKGLTKVCFEAIVRSVLRGTASDHRMSRNQIVEGIAGILPGHPREILKVQIDGALKRLNKKFIRHWMNLDEFCLTWEERTRLESRVTELSALDDRLRGNLSQAISISLDEAGISIGQRELEEVVTVSRSVLERILLERGEAFAVAVTRGRHDDIRFNDIEAVIDKVALQIGHPVHIATELLAGIVQGLFLDPPDDIRTYLRGMSDTYTLFAFLRETPDVQSAIVKIFSDADIWLDTSVVLPLLAEELLDVPARNHTSLIAAAREAGLRIFITDGVLEELVTHVRRCASYFKALTNGVGARGEPPFLFGVYRLSGRDSNGFNAWLENFSGSDPETDLLEYLDEEHGILPRDLTEFSNQADTELRAMVAEVWHKSRDRKDQRLASLGLPAMDTTTRARLIDHDVENYVGIVKLREVRGERRSAYGYRSWWLTLDGTAFRVHDSLKESMEGAVPSSPAISPDFMINYLSIGPIRSKLSRRSESMLPLMLNMHALDAVPPDLIALADDLRNDLAGLQPRVVRRKIRETLEDARKLLGPTARAGEVGLTDEIKAKLREQALRR